MLQYIIQNIKNDVILDNNLYYLSSNNEQENIHGYINKLLYDKNIDILTSIIVNLEIKNKSLENKIKELNENIAMYNIIRFCEK